LAGVITLLRALSETQLVIAEVETSSSPVWISIVRVSWPAAEGEGLTEGEKSYITI